MNFGYSLYVKDVKTGFISPYKDEEDTQRIFDTLKDAEDYLRATKENISNSLNAFTEIKTRSGFLWRKTTINKEFYINGEKRKTLKHTLNNVKVYRVKIATFKE